MSKLEEATKYIDEEFKKSYRIKKELICAKTELAMGLQPHNVAHILNNMVIVGILLDKGEEYVHVGYYPGANTPKVNLNKKEEELLK